MCARYHWTVKPYWVIAAHIVLLQGVISLLVMGDEIKGRKWARERATRLTKLILFYQLVAGSAQYFVIGLDFWQNGDSNWENYSRLTYLICNSSAALTAIQLSVQYMGTLMKNDGVRAKFLNPLYLSGEFFRAGTLEDKMNVIEEAAENLMVESNFTDETAEEEQLADISHLSAADCLEALTSSMSRAQIVQHCNQFRRLDHGKLSLKVIDTLENMQLSAFERAHPDTTASDSSCSKICSWLSSCALCRWCNDRSTKGMSNDDALARTALILLLPVIPAMVTHSVSGSGAYAWVPFVFRAFGHVVGLGLSAGSNSARVCLHHWCTCCNIKKKRTGSSRLGAFGAACLLNANLVFTFSTCSTYAILLYSGHSYIDVMVLEWESHSTSAYFDCIKTHLVHEWATFTDILALF
jgi:hypothetical protein